MIRKHEIQVILGIIDSERIEIEEQYNNARNKKEEDEKLITELHAQLRILHQISNKIHHTYEFVEDEGFTDILLRNHDKYDTELKALNGDTYIVKKDAYCGILGNILNFYEPPTEPATIPETKYGINLDTIVEIKTIKE